MVLSLSLATVVVMFWLYVVCGRISQSREDRRVARS